MLAEQQLELQSLSRGLVSLGYFPGATVAIGTASQRHSFCVGGTTYDQNFDVSLETLYDCASLTKVIVTTTLVLQLVAAGRITLDTKVSSILPEFRHPEVTVQHLLTHTSGLPAMLGVQADLFPLPLAQRIARIKERVYGADLVAPPGVSVTYSDIGFVALGFLVEAIYGEPISVVARRQIFEPLGMNDTYFGCELTPDLVARCAPTELSPYLGRVIQGEVHDENGWQMGGAAGHAGLFSTADDVGRFAQMILRGGELDGYQCLPPDLVTKLFEPLTPEGEIKRSLGYLAFDTRSQFSDSLNSRASILHTGFTGTSILIDKGKDIFIVILSNRVHPTRENQLLVANRKRIHHEILQILTSAAQVPPVETPAT
ncbi:MAG: beta-lactamase family protein [Cellulomonadaceae bacterium]|jgi:CubicO group peptidase (beta-lactamase class C family)|nr:beta-lactamase family protein [Cellulomonadaceae bacterium]